MPAAEGRSREEGRGGARESRRLPRRRARAAVTARGGACALQIVRLERAGVVCVTTRSSFRSAVVVVARCSGCGGSLEGSLTAVAAEGSGRWRSRFEVYIMCWLSSS